MVILNSNVDVRKMTSTPTKEALAKTLIIRAWRQRWTDVQWGIHVRSLIQEEEDGTFIASCMLQQALNGPGPNSLVLSYLVHSIYAQIIPVSAILRSISQYDGYHKPFCIISLLDLLESLKTRIIVDHNLADQSRCIDLAVSLESVIHWLLTCMYSSLENLSDLSFPDASDTNDDSNSRPGSEDSTIVTKCRNLLSHLLSDGFISSLLHVAVLEDEGLFSNIKKMTREVNKFSEGRHKEDIQKVVKLIDQLKIHRMKVDHKDLQTRLGNYWRCLDGKQLECGCPCVQAIVMFSALLKNCSEAPNIINDLLIVKQLKNLSNVDFFAEIFQSTMNGLVDSISKAHESKLLGFTFLQLPSLLNTLKEKSGSSEDIIKGLKTFLANESALNTADAKLHCNTLDHFLASLVKTSVLSEADKTKLLEKRKNTPNNQTPGNSVWAILKAESTLTSVLKTLDGDYGKNQDAILSVLCDMRGKSFELVLTAAYYTGRIQQITSRLIKLNQCSRQVTGESSKASATRAMIFDISFLMLCYIVQAYGSKSLPTEECGSFFKDWYNSCMVDGTVAKNPDSIVARCDQKKVDLLLNQYLQGDTELNTSLVFWHELCTNSIGVVQHLLLAWENDAINFSEVKKILDVFRSRMCSLPVCISAWLCAYVQVMPEEQCGKARYILNHFLNPVSSDETDENFKERCNLMTTVIAKMMSSAQPSLASPSMESQDSDSKPVAELIKKCWNCIIEKGLIDVETTVSLKKLLQVCGPHVFVQNMVENMLELSYSLDLLQCSDLLCGIFHLDLGNCVPALIRVVIPSILHYGDKSVNIVEPQLLALVCLAVDCIVSYYHHIRPVVKEEVFDDSEPQSKRRKLSVCEIGHKENLQDLENMIKDLFEDFDKILAYRKMIHPQVIFILRFLERLSIKTPDVTLLHFVSSETVNHLVEQVGEEMNPALLLSLHKLNKASSRRGCVQAICRLSNRQKRNKLDLDSDLSGF